jgi:hypothetical protein
MSWDVQSRGDTIVGPFVRSNFPSLPFNSFPSSEFGLSKADPLGSGFRFGERGDGLCTVPGSDVFRAGLWCCTSIDRDLLGPAAPDEDEAAGIESRLMRPNALTRGAEPWRRRGSEDGESCGDAAATAAEEEDVGETGEAGE